jgi:hypothetical protein
MSADVAKNCVKFCAEHNLPKEDAVSLFFDIATSIDWYYDMTDEAQNAESHRRIDQAWKEYIEHA